MISAIILISALRFGFANGLPSLANPKETDFSRHAILDPYGNFQLFWSYDQETVTFQYHAMSKGWAGLGFSPNGAMAGADIAVFWLDESGKGFVSDRHASENGFPPEDKHQDYTLMTSTKNETHIIVTFNRKKVTCDTEDWALGADTTRVIYAANDNIPQDENTFQKHTVRGSKSLLLFSDRPDTQDGVPPEPGATPMEFRMVNVTVPDNTDTLYWCEFQPIPQITKKHQIIKVEPIIQPENVDVVHHMLIYICPSFNASKYVGRGAPCFDGDDEVVTAFGQCQVFVLGAWAVGGQSVTYPENTGIPIYNPNGDQYVMIEMHYDNSQYKKGKVDSSGMRFWMTENLRPIDVGQAGMGIDVTKYAQVLPPGVSELTNYGYCSAQCTKDFPEDGVKIIGGLLHTHLAGRKIRFLHYRNGVQLPNIMTDDYYDFNYQDYRRLDDPITVLPGDELVVECIYSTMDRNTTTFAGPSTHDEMCLVYLDYYPAAFGGFACISGQDKEVVLTAIDGYDPINDTIPGCDNPSTKQCVKDHKWTATEIDRLRDIQRNGLHYAACLKEVVNVTASGNISTAVIDIYHEYGYPNVTKPLVIPDVCAGGAVAVTAKWGFLGYGLIILILACIF